LFFADPAPPAAARDETREAIGRGGGGPGEHPKLGIGLRPPFSQIRQVIRLYPRSARRASDSRSIISRVRVGSCRYPVLAVEQGIGFRCGHPGEGPTTRGRTNFRRPMMEEGGEQGGDLRSDSRVQPAREGPSILSRGNSITRGGEARTDRAAVAATKNAADKDTLYTVPLGPPRARARYLGNTFRLAGVTWKCAISGARRRAARSGTDNPIKNYTRVRRANKPRQGGGEGWRETRGYSRATDTARRRSEIVGRQRSSALGYHRGY